LKRKYIHRLHVLNPLTNTDIIGHVQYFKVQPKDSVTRVSSQPNIECQSPTVKAIEMGEPNNWTAGHHIVPEDKGSDATLQEFVGKVLDKEQCVKFPASTVFRPKKSARSLSWNISIQIPNSNFSENGKIDVSPGQVTQFAQVVSPEHAATLPKTQKYQKRLLSYRNAVSASGIPASFYEWAKLLKEDHNEGDYDKVHFTHSDKTVEESVQQEIDASTWDAVLFATDDDFLSSSAIRKMFLENALCVEDSTLFEMKEYTGEEPPRRDAYIPEQPMCELM
jgi:hypothetical protein